MKTLSELDISPAPWKTGDYYENEDIVFSAGGQKVAEDLRTTDARLCAAAPELYEALREMYEDFAPICNAECHGCKYEQGCNKWIAKARAALEKAGGSE